MSTKRRVDEEFEESDKQTKLLRVDSYSSQINNKPDPRRLSTYMAGEGKKHPQYPFGMPFPEDSQH